MLTARLQIETARRSWNPFRRRRFLLLLPEHWEEVQPDARRRRWWRWAVILPPAAAGRAMVRDLIPATFRRRMSEMDFAALALQLSWTTAEPQCEHVPIPHYTMAARMYHFPTTKGENMTCIEYAIADEYYTAYADGDTAALPLLTATLWRQSDNEPGAALRRGDRRVPLYDKAEIVHRARVLSEAPAEIHLQSLHYFGGLKKYIHRVYGNWLFEQPDDEGGDDDEEPMETTGTTGQPDFGWWGIFQEVAESGTFGDIKAVYQAPLHEVCVFLVRRRVQQEQTGVTAPPSPTNDDDDGI